jgi:hypothetical protein
MDFLQNTTLTHLLVQITFGFALSDVFLVRVRPNITSYQFREVKAKRGLGISALHH